MNLPLLSFVPPSAGSGERGIPSLTLLQRTEKVGQGVSRSAQVWVQVGCSWWEVNEHHLGHHDVFLFHCLQRQVGTTWSQAGAMKGSSSSIRWLGLRPEQLEWDTVSPEAPARVLLLQKQALWAPRPAALVSQLWFRVTPQAPRLPKGGS